MPKFWWYCVQYNVRHSMYSTAVKYMVTYNVLHSMYSTAVQYMVQYSVQHIVHMIAVKSNVYTMYRKSKVRVAALYRHRCITVTAGTGRERN